MVFIGKVNKKNYKVLCKFPKRFGKINEESIKNGTKELERE